MISAFFQDLRSLHQSEIDDLMFDSEGLDVLDRRLAEKRGQIDFLTGMMEQHPEMVAVVFHRGFAFGLPAVMDDLLSREADEFPDWDSLAPSVQLAPWARNLADTVLKEPGGEWFMTVAAGLEYMAGRPMAVSATEADGADDEDDAGDDEHEQTLDADDLRGSARPCSAE